MPRRARWAAAGIGLIVLVAAGYLVVGRSFRCFADGACSSGGTERYAGRLFRGDGRALGGAALEVSVFEHNGRRTFDLRADAEGRFCFEWPAQIYIPKITVVRGQPSDRVDPHLRRAARSVGAKPRSLYALRSPESPWDAEASAASVTEVDGWVAKLDQASTCGRLS